MWPCTPWTASRPLMLPRRPFLIVSPTRSTEVGSPTMHQSSRSPRSRRRSQTTAVPSTEGPSSSLVSSSAIDNAGSGWAVRNSSAATTKAAIEVFMSAAPRPYSLPSRCAGVNGSLVHCSSGPVGTTSVWPANTTVRPRPGSASRRPGRLAHRLVTRKVFGPLSMVSATKPSGFRRSPTMRWHCPSSGVTERRAISCSARCSARFMSRSVSLLHVERDLGERRLVGHVVFRSAFFLALAVLAGEIVLQPPLQIGGRIGVGHALLLVHQAFHDQPGDVMLEGLRALGHRLFHRLLDAREVAFFDQLGDQFGVQQHLHRRRAAAVHRAQQPLRHHGLERRRQVAEHGGTHF